MTGVVRRVVRRASGLAGLLIVLGVVGAAVLAPLVATHDPEALDVLNRFAGPSGAHWLGTDHVGRDLFSRLVYGCQVAMLVALLAIAAAAALGIPLGIAAAYAPPAGERPILVLFDVVSAFPSLILALAVVAVWGPGLRNVVLIVAATLAPQFGRVARAQVLALRAAPFLEAERILGASGARVVLRHVLPNIAGTLIVLGAMDIPTAVTVEAGLSFIGLGVQPPLASWGTLINDGYAYLTDSAWPVLAASAALALATLGFTLFGEALRDAVDPRMRPEH